jgi:hypothetical protein
MLETTYKFRGQDAAYVLQLHLKYANVLYTSYEFKHGGDVYNLLKERVTNALRNESNLFMKRRICENDDKRFYYSNDIDISHLVVNADHVDHLSFVRHLLQHRCGFCIFIIRGTDKVYFYGNHQIFDGITCIRAIESVCDNPLLDGNLIPKFRYLPFITELISAKCIPHLLNFKHHRSLSVDYDYLSFSPEYTDLSGANGFTGYTGKFSKFTGPVADIFTIKSALQKHLGRKISFSVIVSALVATHYIKYITKKLTSVNIGIVGAFRNPNICNNFGLIIVPIQIKPVVDLFDILIQIDKCVSSYGASMMIATYLATNVYELTVPLNNSVDIVISYVPTVHRGKIDNVDFTAREAVLPCVSMPAYSLIVATNGNYIINSTIITDDVDFQSFSNNPIIETNISFAGKQEVRCMWMIWAWRLFGIALAISLMKMFVVLYS